MPKKLKWGLIILLCSMIFFSCLGDEKNNEKEYWKGSVEDINYEFHEFATYDENRYGVFLILDKKSSFNFSKEYTPKDFPQLSISSIIDLTSLAMEQVKKQLIDDKCRKGPFRRDLCMFLQSLKHLKRRKVIRKHQKVIRKRQEVIRKRRFNAPHRMRRHRAMCDR